jgi:hypothetical protein
MLTNGSSSVLYNDVLVLTGDTAALLVYTYVHDLYIADYDANMWWANGSGTIYTPGSAFTSSYALHPVVVPQNIDRLGLLLFGQAAPTDQVWAYQTFMTDGFVQAADFGPTPTPI